MLDFGAIPIDSKTFGRTVFIIPVQFQYLVESMPRCIEAVLVINSGPKPY